MLYVIAKCTQTGRWQIRVYPNARNAPEITHSQIGATIEVLKFEDAQRVLEMLEPTVRIETTKKAV